MEVGNIERESSRSDSEIGSSDRTFSTDGNTDTDSGSGTASSSIDEFASGEDSEGEIMIEDEGEGDKEEVTPKNIIPPGTRRGKAPSAEESDL